MKEWTQSWARQAHDQPNKVAMIDCGRHMTYQALHEQAQAISRQWAAMGVGVGDRVVIEYDKGIDWVACVWASGILGAVWSPCPPQTPADRRVQLYQKCDPKLIVGVNKCEAKAAKAPCVDQAAYLIFTSGSTSEPKGVLVGDGGIEPMLRAQREAFEVTRSSVGWWVLSPAFDASISDVGTILGAGGTLLVTPSSHWLRENTFRSTAQRYGVNIMDVPPSWLARQKFLPECLRTVVAGGEPTASHVLDAWAGKLRWINVYGPTETTVCSSLERVFSGRSHGARPTIGTPIGGSIYSLGDPRLAKRSVGDVGELWIGGPGVALEYWRDPDLTAQKFVDIEGARWFKTGDIVQRQASNWGFLGRTDRQIKIRGQLIDLNEVEFVLGQSVDVLDVLAWLDNVGHLVLAYKTTGMHGKDLIKQQLTDAAKKSLPSWGVPQKWFLVDSWPRTTTGKTDASKIKQTWEESQ